MNRGHWLLLKLGIVRNKLVLLVLQTEKLEGHEQIECNKEQNRHSCCGSIRKQNITLGLVTREHACVLIIFIIFVSHFLLFLFFLCSFITDFNKGKYYVVMYIYLNTLTPKFEARNFDLNRALPILICQFYDGFRSVSIMSKRMVLFGMIQ